MTNDSQGAVNKIEEFQKFGSILGLERMKVLLDMLGNPQKDLKVIHVAGTNGKGSICKYIYSALQANGYKVGLFTSPFIEIFNERIEYDGKYITDEELTYYTNIVLEKTNAMVEQGSQSPTEFEVITAIMFMYFKDKKPDFVVLEVGLGGRGDSTNVIEKPLVSVIASISFDHTDRLGDTLGKIAYEKSGIIKEGCPVVTSCESPEALQVIMKKAEESHSPCYVTNDFSHKIVDEKLNGYVFNTTIFGTTYDGVEISMIGEHQIKNCIGALTALRILEERGYISLTRERLYYGLDSAIQKGRFEIVGRNPYFILDGAHNPDGAKMLKETVNRHFKGQRILMVTGMLADKDTENIIENFAGITREFIATEPDSPRKMSAMNLASKLEKHGCKATAIENSKEAIELAKEMARDRDLVLIAGSLYLIGAIRGYFA